MKTPTAPRKNLVLTLIWIVAIAAASLGCMALYRQMMNPEKQELPDEGPAVLQTALPGETLDVPAEPGIWLQNKAGTQIIANLAEPMGKPVRINLCDQRTRAPDHPQRIYPVRLLGDASDLQRSLLGNEKLRNPLVLPTAMRAGMPVASITGDAGEPLRLSADQALSAHWALVSDTQNRAGYLSREAWLMWRKPKADGGTEGTGGRFEHAIRFRQQAVKECAAGVLEASLISVPEKLSPAGANQKASITLIQPDGHVLHTRLASGKHSIPLTPPAAIEDKALFNALLQRGLLRVGKQGLIELAPADLLQARKAGVAVPDWADAKLDNDTKDLLKHLYAKADGAYVRAQVNRFNQERMWAALRVQTHDAALREALSDPRNWSVNVDGVTTLPGAGMPDMVARLFSEPPRAVSEWMRVANWPAGSTAASKLRFHLELPVAVQPSKDTSFTLLTMGKPLAVSGARIGAPQPACLTPACPRAETLYRAQLALDAGTRAIDIDLQPDASFSALDPGASEFRHIRVQAQNLVWLSAPRMASALQNKAQATVLAQDGSVLFANGMPTEAAKNLGLLPLVGVSDTHENALAGNLGRLGASGFTEANAHLTIDPKLQAVAAQVLDCVGQQGKRWLPEQGRCSDELLVPPDRKGNNSAFVEGRRSGLIMLNADTGAILAAAGGPGLPADVSTADLLDFDRFNPGGSLLRFWPLQHNGGVEHCAGSTYKVVDAFGLEFVAQKQPRVQALLAGLPVASVDAEANARGYAFAMKGGCYPLPCDGTHPVANNFSSERAIDFAQDGRFGLRQAMSASINTWFAWMVEMSDRSLGKGPSGGQPDAQVLGGTALDAMRPVVEVAHRLGFESRLSLDAGLMPEDYRWQAWDVLRAIPSEFDPIGDRHQVRLQAIGSRMQVTPLQMAIVAASVAQGKIVQPWLLAELNGRKAQPAAPQPLGIPLERIRAGMKDVVQARGTAQSAFERPALKAMRGGVYAKTGTAEVKSLGANTVWFIGYIEPNTLPGETRRLAFATFVTRSSLTGGAHAAPVIAGMMETLAVKHEQK